MSHKIEAVISHVRDLQDQARLAERRLRMVTDKVAHARKELDKVVEARMAKEKELQQVASALASAQRVREQLGHQVQEADAKLSSTGLKRQAELLARERQDVQAQLEQLEIEFLSPEGHIPTSTRVLEKLYLKHMSEAQAEILVAAIQRLIKAKLYANPEYCEYVVSSNDWSWQVAEIAPLKPVLADLKRGVSQVLRVVEIAAAKQLCALDADEYFDESGGESDGSSAESSAASN